MQALGQGAATIVALAVGLALVVLFLFGVMARLYRKVGPNQALIVYGFGGTRIVRGAGAVVLPLVQSWDGLSLELMSFDVAPQQDLYTRQGVAVTVEAVAQIKVKSDPESILTAAEQFLRKAPEEREGLIRLVMEGHLRGIVGQLTVEQIVKEPEMVAERMRANVAGDMNKMGLEVVSFTIREVKDKNDYIANMGRPDIARVKRDADIAAAELERDTAIRQAETMREAAVARAEADRERVIAEMASKARQAEAERDLSLKKAEFDQATKTAQAQADKAYDIQANVMQQQVVAEQVRVERIQREEQIKVQEAEVQRRERELEATVLKPAEAERRRIEVLAGAEQQRRELEAKGQAGATRSQGTAQAEITRVQGQAEADIIRAKGESEAAAMTVRAAAFHEYNQAAVLDKLLAGLPEVARAFAEPLSKVDKITIVSTGADGRSGMGASQITEDLTKMIAQAPALFEALTGLKVADLMARLPGIAEPMPNGERDAQATPTTPVGASDG
ncbi:MAG TPA: SPFH domain-containing protein [Chloroflexota bacterium]|nr:SPFH domain-containing protein [Chloroflexota bacterium]